MTKPAQVCTRAELEHAAERVHAIVPPTPQHAWPLLAKALGTDVWVKHENHTPTGAFKVRGGVVYMHDLKQSDPNCQGVISATRGNHGQSIALAATRAGLQSLIYVPKGNSVEKNAAMRAFGAELVEHGVDFDEAKDACITEAAARGLHLVPPFHPLLVRGVATYGLELLTAQPDLDVIYVPIGMGSGVCGLITARDLLGVKTAIVGVVAQNAPAVGLSFESRTMTTTASANTFADGMACRVPDASAMEIMWRGMERVVEVSEDEVAKAVRLYFTATHNVAEGAGAAPLAAAQSERAALRGKRVGLVLSGGNIDAGQFMRVLEGHTPQT